MFSTFDRLLLLTVLTLTACQALPLGQAPNGSEDPAPALAEAGPTPEPRFVLQARRSSLKLAGRTINANKLNKATAGPASSPPPSGPSAGPAASLPSPVPAVALASPTAEIKAPPYEASEVLRLSNIERSKAGLELLSLNPRLNQVAQAHVRNMAATGSFSHVIQGLGPAERVTAAGYSWHAVGENIAYGYGTPASVVLGWVNSPGHRANILGAAYTEMGVGHALSPKGISYWVQVFATP